VTKHRRRHIGIVGAEIAGLHLGLRLRQLGIDATIIADRSPDEVVWSRLANTVVHWPATLERERLLGIRHWPAEEFGFRWVHNIIHTPEPITIQSRSAAPARGIDHRIYLPRLMEDFVARGGRIEVSPFDVQDVDRLAERFDLLVIATPKGGYSRIFAKDLENSPFDRPQRLLLAGLYTGFHPALPRRVNISIAPGQGEALAVPMLSRTGMVTAVYISAMPDGDLASLQELSYATDRAGFRMGLLAKLEQHHPTIFDRIDTSRFDLQGPQDYLQGGVTPVVRHPIAMTSTGKYAVALGDVHVTVDPLLGQGANIGSFSAWELAETIAEAGAFDTEFCKELARRRTPRVLGASQWTNLFLLPPDDAKMELFTAMSRSQDLANEYLDNFSRPERQWERLRSPESIRAWLREKLGAPSRPAAMIAFS
jgi:2-polyprenyl-6-methoxyphenol hydroxylase-like FAD-dependent oxidoreductase